MSELTIYGYSDDLVELEGDIREEWEAFDAGTCYIAISDGTLLYITYDNEGIWRITPCVIGDGTKFENKQAVAAEWDNSDIVKLTNETVPFVWAVFSFNKDDASNPTMPATNPNQYLKRVGV